MSDAYEGLEGDFGFLIEATTVQPALTGTIFPWGDGRAHKD